MHVNYVVVMSINPAPEVRNMHDVSTLISFVVNVVTFGLR